MRSISMLVLVLVLVLGHRSARADRVWIVGGVGLGGGSGRIGPIHATAMLDVEGFVGERVGVFATVAGYGANEGEAAGVYSRGRLAAAGVCARMRWHRAYAFAALGAGIGHHAGIEWASDVTNDQRPFAATVPAWSARLGAAWTLGHLTVAIQAVGNGYARAFAIAPFSVAAGTAF